MQSNLQSIRRTGDYRGPAILDLPIRQNCTPSTSYHHIAGQNEWIQGQSRGNQSTVCFARQKKSAVIDVGDEAAMYDEVRPWTSSIPTLEEVLYDPGWPYKVEDWMMFWGMFQNWQWAHEQVNYYDGDVGPVALQQMRWLQLPTEIVFKEPQKLEKVIDIVVAAIPFLISSGVPVPEFLRGKAPWHTGYHDLITASDQDGEQYLIRGEIKGAKPLFEAPPRERPAQFVHKEASRARPWDDWDEWDFRVFMEKKKRKRQNLARFAKKQAEVGKRRYLVVSPLTDTRFAESTPFYPNELREHTHEEYMDVVLGNGKYTDPRDVPVKVKDPAVYADAFEEGAHWVPDVEEYCRSIGRLVETEEELIGVQEEGPSATLDEEFEMGSDLSDLSTEGGEEALEVVPDDEPAAMGGDDL